MMDKNVKVSIIIPAYNAEAYIERCLKSATNQTLKEIEVIIINDGSTDRTHEIIEELSHKDNRIIILNKQNEGVSVARNRGVEIAKGEYIQFLDADDWIEPTACEKMYNFAKKEHLDIVVSDFFKDDDHGNIKLRKDLNQEKKIYSNKEYLSNLFIFESYGYVWNKLFSRKLYKDIIFPEDISLGEDFFQTAVLASKATKIGKYNEAFVHYIVNPTSLTQYQASKKMYHMFRTYEIIHTHLQKDIHYNTYKELLEKMRLKSTFVFLKMEPYFGDKEYEKGIEKTLEYFRSKPKIHNNLNFTRRLKMTFLKKFPSRKNIVRIIKLHNKDLKK
ncbi:MAG: glycosyltransferase family 2 protein [Sulfurimonas sp.]